MTHILQQSKCKKKFIKFNSLIYVYIIMSQKKLIGNCKDKKIMFFDDTGFPDGT